LASISVVDRKLLWGLSGNECAFPGCTQTLTLVPLAAGAASASSVPVVVGEEAHIVAEEDDGPRGDSSTPIRNAYPNLILMCPTHHRLIDKDHGRHYSVNQLRQMKADHEALVERRRVGSSGDKETRARRRQELLLEAASASRGRLIARWLAAGVSPRLAESLADDDSVGALWSPSEAARTMLRLPLFLIVAILRYQAGAQVPRSQGTFLDALANAALERSHIPTAQARQALFSLARLTIEFGGTAVAAELGSDEAVRSVLETRLVVRAGRSLHFALPVVEQYFAARSVLESGLDGIDLDDLRLLDRWRDSLTLAVTVGSWRQVSALLDTLTPRHPGLMSWLVVNAIPMSTGASSSDVPSQPECARRLRHATAGWINSLGPVGQLLGLTDSLGRLRTVGTSIDGNSVFAGLRLGDNAGTETTQLPYGLNLFTAKAPDGSDWVPLRHGNAPTDFMAWPWQWGLDWVSASVEGLLRTKALPLPATKPFQDERRWQLAKAVMRRRGFQHGPIDQAELRRAAEGLLTFMADNGAGPFQPQPRRRPVFGKDEIITLVRELDEGGILAEDGKLHRPYPVPDVVPSSTVVGSQYSDEALRELVEEIHTDALVIYQDLVGTWFPMFTPMLGLACIMPVLFTGRVMPRGDSFGGPDFVYYVEPLPVTESARAEIRLAHTREELFSHNGHDLKLMMEYDVRLRRLITTLHPGAEGWAYPRSANADLWVWGDRPATAQAYRWLWEDLQELHVVKQIAPVGEE
jgi:hypothetical protein